MPKLNEMMPSKYLKKEDCEPPLLLTITGVEQDSLENNGQTEQKWVLLFKEAKGLVLNSTNMQLAAQACGSDDTDDWIGKKIVAYSDPNVSFGGKLVGGVRLRAPKKTKTAPAAPEIEEDIPF